LTGEAGESAACALLLSKGFSILDTNIFCGGGELDIVAFDPVQQELVFCEVKARTNARYGHPAYAVDWRKTRALRRAAGAYLNNLGLHRNFRFDCITVTPHGLQHFENITCR
jgi:putative endonuclease